jgi:cobalt-zinc-cadmium efflux system outer membrane protein
VDRLEVEHSRLLSSARDAEATREGALIACSTLLGAPCPRFDDEEQARRFLVAHPEGDQGAQAAGDLSSVGSRPDLQALRAERARLSAELTLAQRQAIPDPVASVGYTHDQFLLAGNQANSLNVSVSIPLPLFDRGQTEAARARRRLATNQLTSRTLTDTALRTAADQRRQLALLAARARILEDQAVPRARSVVERTQAAFQRGGVGFPDVLLARRAFEELELDRIEVAATAHRASLNLRRATASLPWPAPALSSNP